MRTVIPALLVAASLAFVPACEKKPATPAAGGGDHKHDGHDHGHEGHEHAEALALGTATIGGFSVTARRDKGEIAAGKDAPIDVTVTPTAGGKVAAVRFWIGAEDARGSVKAKAEIEDPKDPTTWHTHAEIPSPIPAGSKLWVEIEDDKGSRSVGSFALKM